MSCAEQVVLFQQAKLVLGTHGAGLTNIIHCKSGTPVVRSTPPRRDRPCYPARRQIFALRPILILTPLAGRRHDIAVPISALDRMMEKYG